MNKFLSALVDLHARIADSPSVWFPFWGLRPNPATRISFSRTLVMAPCFAITFCLLVGVRRALFGEGGATAQWFQELPLSYLRVTLGFLIWINVATRPLWNLRREIRNRSAYS